jgi:hypothetical protein
MYQLVVIYSDGQKQIFDYESRAAAERAENGMRIALGNQIAWTCVRVRIF